MEHLLKRKLAVLLLTTALLMTGITLLSGGAEATQTIGPPGNPVGVGGVGCIDVSWSPAPGAPSQYYVYWSTVSGTVQVSGYPTTVGGTTSHVTMGGAPDYPSPLPPGYSLYFQICADYGPSGYRYSGWTGPVTTVNYPGVPGSVQAQASGEAIALSWSAPASNGGAEITSYKIFRGTSSGALSEIASAAGTAREHVDSTAAGGGTYFYAVAAFNGYSSGLSAEASATLPPGKPGTARDLQCVPGADNITISWSAPEKDGGSAVTGYKVYRSLASGEETLIGRTGGASRSYVDLDVTVGQTYFYQVSAVNLLGESARGSEVEVTYVAPPSSPQNLSAFMAPGEIRLTWDEPASNGGSPIIWYDIYRNNVTADDGWTWYDYTEAVRSYNDAGVQLGCTYQYAISAWNEDFIESDLSEMMEVRFAVPSEPLNIAASASGRGSLLISWDAPAVEGITAYVVHWGTVSGVYRWNATYDIGSIAESKGRLSITLDGLEDNTLYFVTVSAVNGLGNGDAGTPASATTVVPPGPVTDLKTISNGKGKINVFWDLPSGTDASSLTKYTVYRGTSALNTVFLADVAVGTPYFFDQGLQDGVTYYYRVTATSDVGEGASATITGKCGFPPGVPVGLTAVGGLDSITLSWDEPAYTGGGIIKYIICRSATADGYFLWLGEADGDVTSYVDVVGQNATWFYKVYAASPMGTSTFSNGVSASSYGPPAAPIIVNVEPSDGKVHLVWTAPRFEGRPDIAGYRLYRGTSPSELSLIHDAGPTLEYNDTGLINGVMYYYAVLAYSAAFDGPLSAPMAGSPGTVPSPPGLLPAKVGDSYVMLSWTSSANDGGRAITAYELYRAEGDAPDWSARVLLLSSVSALEHNDTTVVNGHTYHYWVVAVNEMGSSEHDGVATCLPCRAPGAPSELTAEGGDEVVHLAWSAPAEMGGGIHHYLVYRGPSADRLVLIGTIGNVTFYVDEDVVVGTRYHYAVAASNWAGAGTMSATAANSTIYRPGVPLNVEAASDVDSVHLSWERPAADGNAPLGYRIYRSTAGGGEVLIAEIGPVLRFDNIDLVSGTAYHYRVAAFNSLYESDASSEVSAVPYNVPSAPADLEVERGVRSLAVAWSAPSSDNGAAVLGYRVLVWAPGASGPSTYDAGLTDHYLITGLLNGTTYSVKIVAYNLAGDGAESAAAQAAAFAPSSAPAVSTASGNGWASIAWTAPASDAPVTGYKIYRGPGPGELRLLAAVGTVTGFNDTGVENGEAYYYAVAAVSEVGEGARSDAVPTVPSTVPDAPKGLEAVPGIGHVSLVWISPDSDGGAEITGYNVYRGRTADAMTWLAAVFSTGYDDADGAPGEVFLYRVVAMNARGEGGSAEVTAASLFPPPAPSSLAVIRTGQGAVITWEMPAQNSTSAQVTGFAIYRQSAGGEPVLIAVIDGSEARSYSDAEAPEGPAVYSVAALNGSVSAGALSMSQSAEVAAGGNAEGTYLMAASFALIGLSLLFMAASRRRRERQ